MIITVEEARKHIEGLSSWTDEKIARKLKAIEQTIRSFTNNDFQDRAYKRTADIVGGSFLVGAANPFVEGDTVQICYGLNKGLFTIDEATETSFTVDEKTVDEAAVTAIKIVYPEDVVDCCLNMLEWEFNNRAKVGIKSETLSRHSVTYFDLDSNNQVMGYPVSLLGALKAYKKARC